MALIIPMIMAAVLVNELQPAAIAKSPQRADLIAARGSGRTFFPPFELSKKKMSISKKLMADAELAIKELIMIVIGLLSSSISEMSAIALAPKKRPAPQTCNPPITDRAGFEFFCCKVYACLSNLRISSLMLRSGISLN